MTHDEMINQNLDLLSNFMSYAFEHPDILGQIPPDATLVILPSDNRELYEVNLKTAKKSQEQNKVVVTIEWGSTKPISPDLKVLPQAE